MKDLDARADQINRFEPMLVNEGALVLKFWFHLTKEGQKKRLKALEKDPHTAWRVTKWNWDRLKTYDKLQEVAGHVLRMTNTPWAPWIIVEGTDDRYRSLTVGKILLEAHEAEAGQPRQAGDAGGAAWCASNIDGRNVLSELDLNHKLTDKAYESRAGQVAGALSELVRDAALQEPLAGLRLRGGRRRRQGRRHPAHRCGAGCARSTRSCPWPRRPRRSGPSPTCGGSGGTFRARGGSSSSTAPGTAACWSSGSRGSAPRTTGCVPTPRSTTSSTSWPTPA